MVKRGDTAIADLGKALAWHPRRGLDNDVTFLRGTIGTVVSARRNRYGLLSVRAMVEGRVCTLHSPEWVFTRVRVGELRRWRDDRDVPFLIVGMDSKGVSCLSDGTKWGATIRYIERETEVVGA